MPRDNFDSRIGRVWTSGQELRKDRRDSGPELHIAGSGNRQGHQTSNGDRLDNNRGARRVTSPRNQIDRYHEDNYGRQHSNDDQRFDNSNTRSTQDSFSRTGSHQPLPDRRIYETPHMRNQSSHPPATQSMNNHHRPSINQRSISTSSISFKQGGSQLVNLNNPKARTILPRVQQPLPPLTVPQPAKPKPTTKPVIKRAPANPELVAVGDSLSDYTLQDQVGEGTFGKVYKATRKKDSLVVALKRVRIETEKEGLPLTAIREIMLLTKLKHAKVVQLHELLSSISDGPDVFIYMVFEYMEHDLTGLLASGVTFKPEHVKCLNKQLFEGLAYIHSLNVLHRDIKGSNILLNAKGQLKIADFGLARLASMDSRPKNYTNRVVTLWYRPPELLLGAVSYDKSIDIWSAGCIYLELVTLAPVFCGKDEITQLDKIWRICGPPDLASYPEVKALPWWCFLAPKKDAQHKRDFKQRFSRFERSIGSLIASLLTVEGLNLVESLLELDPAKRPTADQVLAHAYFTELPLACEPSELPSIKGHWHEFESKLQKKEVMKTGIATEPNPSALETVDDPMLVDDLAGEPIKLIEFGKDEHSKDSKMNGKHRKDRSRSRHRSRNRHRSRSRRQSRKIHIDESLSIESIETSDSEYLSNHQSRHHSTERRPDNGKDLRRKRSRDSHSKRESRNSKEHRSRKSMDSSSKRDTHHKRSRSRSHEDRRSSMYNDRDSRRSSYHDNQPHSLHRERDDDRRLLHPHQVSMQQPYHEYPPPRSDPRPIKDSIYPNNSADSRHIIPPPPPSNKSDRVQPPPPSQAHTKVPSRSSQTVTELRFEPFKYVKDHDGYFSHY